MACCERAHAWENLIKSFKTKEEAIEYRAELQRIHLYYFITDKRKNKKKDEYNNKCY